MSWAGHVACMGVERNVYKVLARDIFLRNASERRPVSSFSEGRKTEPRPGNCFLSIAEV
jgi:hypothetical protein